MNFNVTIRGIAPLLMHRFLESALTGTDIVGTRTKNPTEKQKKEMATVFLYKDGNGKICIPANMIEAALIAASSEFRLTGAGTKTYKETAKSSIFVFPEMIILKNQKWVVDGRSVRNKITGARVMSYRPRFNEWEIEFNLEVTEPRADVNTLKMMMETAGLRKGLGAYHPRFGRFEVVKFELIDESKKSKK